jgi:hypothetical protein
MKKKSTLYYVELHGIEDTYIFLVGKDLINWIEGKISAPPDLQLAWESQQKKFYTNQTVSQIIKQLEPGQGSTRANDRALSIPEEACVVFFSDVRGYAEWFAKNKNKYIIKDGFYGGIY